MSEERKKHHVLVKIQKETHSDTVTICMLHKEDSVVNPQPDIEIGDINYVLNKAQTALRKRLGNYTNVMNNDLCEIGFDFVIEVDLNDRFNDHREHNYNRNRKMTEKENTE